MPNVPIPIELDKTRHIFFDFNALAVVEKFSDVPFHELMAGLATGVSLATLRALVLGGLYHEDNALTVERVGKLLDPLLKKPARLMELRAVVTRALASVFMDETGEAEKKDAGQVPTATIPKGRGRGRGKNS
jgi:hypothetical protein